MNLIYGIISLNGIIWVIHLHLISFSNTNISLTYYDTKLVIVILYNQTIFHLLVRVGVVLLLLLHNHLLLLKAELTLEMNVTVSR